MKSDGMVLFVMEMETPHDHLRKISGSDLHERTLKLVAEERRVSVAVLWYLREISERGLYLEFGYSSLWEYATHGLKYSSAAAFRRIAAMRALVGEGQVVEEKLKSGELSLTIVAQVESFCEREQRKREKEGVVPSGKLMESVGPAIDKRALLEAAAGKSTRAVERMLADLASGDCPRRDQVRALGRGHTEIRLVVDDALLEKLEQIKDIFAHALGSSNPSYSELIHFMADRMLKQVGSRRDGKLKSESESESESQQQARSQSQSQSQSQPRSQSRSQDSSAEWTFRVSIEALSSAPEVAGGEGVGGRKEVEMEVQVQVAERAAVPRLAHEASSMATVALPHGISDSRAPESSSKRYVPAQIRRLVFLRAGFQCEFVDPRTKRRCMQRRMLELDHVEAFALGGSSLDPNNLRVQCRAHNVWHAQNAFGKRKMASFANKMK